MDLEVGTHCCLVACPSWPFLRLCEFSFKPGVPGPLQTPSTAQAGPEMPRSVNKAPCGTRRMGVPVPTTQVCLGWHPVANTWVEAFIQGKWLNSTNNIVELKCPNPTGGGVLFFHI